jgi:phosphopantetheine--protein transferase-like protein
MHKEIVQVKSIEEIEAILLNNLDEYFLNSELKSLEDKNKIKSLGARYLIKRSILDYLKLDNQYHDIEIENEKDGKPILKYKGEVLNKAEEMNVESFKISISHSGNYISSLVVLEENV